MESAAWAHFQRRSLAGKHSNMTASQVYIGCFTIISVFPFPHYGKMFSYCIYFYFMLITSSSVCYSSATGESVKGTRSRRAGCSYSTLWACGVGKRPSYSTSHFREIRHHTCCLSQIARDSDSLGVLNRIRLIFVYSLSGYIGLENLSIAYNECEQ